MSGVLPLAVRNLPRGTFDHMLRDCAIERHAFESVHVYMRVWLPITCPECGSTGPFRALANWVPVLIDGGGDVIEELSEDIWPVLDETGPGVWCRRCDINFDVRPAMFPLEQRP